MNDPAPKPPQPTDPTSVNASRLPRRFSHPPQSKAIWIWAIGMPLAMVMILSTVYLVFFKNQGRTNTPPTRVAKNSPKKFDWTPDTPVDWLARGRVTKIPGKPFGWIRVDYNWPAPDDSFPPWLSDWTFYPSEHPRFTDGVLYVDPLFQPQSRVAFQGEHYAEVEFELSEPAEFMAQLCTIGAVPDADPGLYRYFYLAVLKPGEPPTLYRKLTLIRDDPKNILSKGTEPFAWTEPATNTGESNKKSRHVVRLAYVPRGEDTVGDVSVWVDSKKWLEARNRGLDRGYFRFGSGARSMQVYRVTMEGQLDPQYIEQKHQFLSILRKKDFLKAAPDTKVEKTPPAPAPSAPAHPDAGPAKQP